MTFAFISDKNPQRVVEITTSMMLKNAKKRNKTKNLKFSVELRLLRIPRTQNPVVFEGV